MTMKIPEKMTDINWTDTRRLLRVLMVICLLALVWHTLYWYREINDDAYISFRYARNLAQGEGFTYNPGERVEGFSNFLWVVLLALSARLGMTDLGMTAKVLGLLFSCGTLILVPLLFRRLYPGIKPLWSALPVLFLALSPYFASWTTRGLEGALFTFMLVGAVYLFAVRIHESYWGSLALSLVFFAVSITRPEGIIFLLVPLAYMAARIWKDRSWQWADLRVILLAVALFTIFLSFRAGYFGELYPNTYFAKTTYGLPFFQKPRAARYIFSFFFRQNPAFTMLMIFGLVTAAATRRLPLLVASPVVVCLAYIWYVNGDWMDNYRFFVPILPFIFILITASIPLVSGLFRDRRRLAVLAVAIFSLASLIYLGYGLRVDRDSRYSRIESSLKLKNRKTWWRAPWKLPSLGFEPLLWDQTRWVLENTPDGSRTAFPDVGFFGYVTDAVIYDTQGLVNRSLSHLFHMRRQKKEVMDDELLKDFLKASPDYVFLRKNKSTGDGINQLERVLLSSGEFQRGWVPGPSFFFHRELKMDSYVGSAAAGKPSYEEVRNRYLEAVRWNPRVPQLYTGLRLVLLKMGEVSQAVVVTREAHERFPYERAFK